MSDLAFRELLDMAMKYDLPGPLSASELGAITECVQEESIRRMYLDWIDAYHTFKPFRLYRRDVTACT